MYYHCVLSSLFLIFPSLNAEVTLTPSTQDIAENSPLTLTCSYSGSLTVSTYTMNVLRSSSQSGVLAGSLSADCSVFTKQPNTSLYEYKCPTSKQLSWTIKTVTRANDDERWECQLGFTTTGSENASFNIRVQVPIQNVVMSIPTNNEITVQENTEIEFVCETSGGLPEATVKWYKHQSTASTTDDVEITNFATTSSVTSDDLISVKSKLVYLPRKEDNLVKIYCTASNSANTKTSSRKQLNVQYSPDGPPAIQNFTNGTTCNIIENIQRTFSCSIVGGNPLPTLSWKCFKSGSASTTTGSTVTKTVVFTASRREDRSCTCQSSHPVAGTQSVTVNVEVLYPPEGPTFKVNGTNVSSPVQFIKGRTRSVVCESIGKPEPMIYTWDKDGQKYSTEKTLTFNGIQRQDQSQYTCTAENTLIASDGSQRPGTNSSTVQVTVLFPPTKPSLHFGGISGQLIQGNTVNVVRRDTLTIACKSEGQPEPKFKWSGQTSNNKTISVSSISHDVSKTCTVTNTMRETYGETKQGSASTTVTLNVLYPPSITNCQMMYTAGSPVHVNGSINVIENNSFILRCSANSRPVANIYWSGTGMTSSTLSVNRISRQQNGTYTIVAENTMNRTFGDTVPGKDIENFYFNVLFPPKLQGLNEKNIVAGSRLNFSCPYEKGNPQETTLKWSRNDSREWNNQNLNIENVTKDDDMMYTCTVKNVMKPTGAVPESGEDSKSFHLNVLYKASIISFVVQGNVDSSSFTVTENDTVPFVCNVDSNPASNIEIKFQDHILKTLGNTESLNFNHDAASCLDAGVYTCSAWNLYNSGKSSVRKLSLYVRCSPRPLIPVIENVTSALWGSVTLKFMGIAYPLPSFTWEKEENSVWQRLSNSSYILISTSGVDTYLTISNVSPGDYGNYQLKISNDIKEFIQPFYLIPEGIPETPSKFVVIESHVTDTSALLQWQPEFNGGPQQTFIIRYKKISDNIWLPTTVQDSGETVMNHTIKHLASDSEYQVVIFAQNRVGNSSSSRNVTFTTREKISKTGDPSKIVGIAAGVGSSSVVVILLIVVFVVFKNRRTSTKGKNKAESDKNDRKRVYEEDENDYGMQDNPMYVSADPRREESGGSGEAHKVYSAVDKNRLVPDSSKNDVYAEVNKPKKTKANNDQTDVEYSLPMKSRGKKGKPEKGKKDKKAKKAMQEGDIYENATTVADTKTMQNTKDETIYENPESSIQKKNVNKDGLIYADLTFNDQPKGQKKLVIHGLDSMTEYVEVDFTKKADPLPDSDDENIPTK